jgi:hypothetical protein
MGTQNKTHHNEPHNHKVTSMCQRTAMCRLYRKGPLPPMSGVGYAVFHEGIFGTRRDGVYHLCAPPSGGAWRYIVESGYPSDTARLRF